MFSLQVVLLNGAPVRSLHTLQAQGEHADQGDAVHDVIMVKTRGGDAQAVGSGWALLTKEAAVHVVIKDEELNLLD